MRAALVRNGIVENLIIAGPDYAPDAGCELVPIGDDPVAIGAAWDGVSFTLPVPAAVPVPEAVTMRQARVALLHLGLFDQVEAALQGIPDDLQRRVALQTWEYSGAVERNNPLILMLGPAIGLTPAQIDGLFRLAATL